MFAAFDDQTSTFIIPSGGGFEVVFCPPGRSSTILATLSSQLHQLAQNGHVSPQLIAESMNIHIVGRNVGFIYGTDWVLWWVVGMTVAFFTWE